MDQLAPKSVAAEPFRVGSFTIELGETADLTLKISESHSGSPIDLPLRVIRGAQPGPAIFVTGAIHGDELNGTGIVRELIVNNPPVIKRGTLMLIPVVNMLGFERHSRYMPDRRDLNRHFPGSSHGSLTARFARAFFQAIVCQCEYGIDLHTAANFRTNIPNIRAQLKDERSRLIAEAFGCELIINNVGPRGSLRRAATRAGCATILLEAGEPWKIQADVVRMGVQGIRNVLAVLKMTNGQPPPLAKQWIAHRTVWVRAAEAGLLHFHVVPGEEVEVDQPIATNTNLLGKHWSVIRARVSGVVMGMTTLPSVQSGDPVCHIAVPDEKRQM